MRQTETDPLSAGPSRLARAVDSCFRRACWAAGLLGILLPLMIVAYLLYHGARVLSWEFLTAAPSGYPLGMHGGIWPAIRGSAAMTGLALAMSVPLAVLSAVHLALYARSQRFIAVMRFLAECLAAVPALVFGVFGYSLLVVHFGFGVSLLAGAITLAMLIYPVILVGAHASLCGVDSLLSHSALSMGVSRAYALRRVLLRQALPGIIAATVLAGGHAFGSAAPIMFTATVVQTRGSLAMDSPVMALPTHLYHLVSEAVSFEHAYGTAFVLVAALLFANACAYALRSQIRRAS